MVRIYDHCTPCFPLFCPHFKYKSTPLFFPCKCREAILRVMWAQSPTFVPLTRTQSTLTIATSMSKPSNHPLRESSRSLTEKTVVDRPRKTGLNGNAEMSSYANVLQKTSLRAVQRSRKRRTRSGRSERARTPRRCRVWCAILVEPVRRPWICKSAVERIRRVSAKQCWPASAGG